MSYSMSGSYLSSPDQSSSVYPDRLIRPLPKRSLRSRLSQEAAETIAFPPVVPSTSLPSYNQCGDNGEYVTEHPMHHHSNGEMLDHEHGHSDEHEHDHDAEDCPHHHHHHHLCHHDYDDDDVQSIEDSSPVARRSKAQRSSPRSPRATRPTRYGSQTSKQSSSGLDGYDAFENTNNKKKRKIPTSGSLNPGHTSLPADLASMGLGSSRDGIDDGAGVGQYYGSGNAAFSAGLGVQGAGRGRNSRRLSGRNPLGPSINGSNIKAGAVPYDQASSETKDGKQDQGIISAAIANATALLRKPLGKGQENVGVLDQQLKQTSTSSQFTFTCESADSKGVTFPEQSLYATGYPQKVHSMPAPSNSSTRATHGTQTTPSVASHPNSHLPAQQAGSVPVHGQKTKPRRRRGDVYALAARQRRLQQEYAQIHHTNSDEERWLCEFCEYESIFGEPPVALIRQYEIKDRKERRRLAEKRRLLEKAKLKGRKGKKQSKHAAKAAHNTGQPAANPAHYDQQPLDPTGDDYLDDGYDDDPISMPTPPPLQAPTKQFVPGPYLPATTGKATRAGGTDGGGMR